MHDPQYVLAAVLVAAAITWALRAVPFALLAPLRHSELIRFLGDHSPVGVMIALVGYTVRNLAWLDPAIALRSWSAGPSPRASSSGGPTSCSVSLAALLSALRLPPPLSDGSAR